MAFLESDFGIRVEDEELIPENFETLRRLGELLESKSPAWRKPQNLPKPDSSTVLPAGEASAETLGERIRFRVRGYAHRSPIYLLLFVVAAMAA